MRLAALAVSILAISGMPAFGPAWGHDWYPPYCCSGGDCAPISDTRVTRDGTDYIIDHRWRIPSTEVKPSLDGRYHGCWPDPQQPPRCIFVPPDGF